MGRKRHKRTSLGHYGMGKPYTIVYARLMDSLAFRTLPNSAVVVFLEMYRVYMKLSHGDYEDIGDRGFSFTYGHFTRMMSRGTFYDAVAEICRRGLFREAPELQNLSPGSPKVYLPSAEWMNFEKSEAGRAALACAASP